MFINKVMFFLKVYLGVMLLIAFAIALVLPTQPALAKLAIDNSQQATRLDDNRQIKKEIFAKQQDPTRPPSVIVQQLSEKLEIKPEFELTAIFSRNKQQYAVVNGTILKTGDALDNMVVTQISDTNITLQNTDPGQLEEIVELHTALNIKKQVIK